MRLVCFFISLSLFLAACRDQSTPTQFPIPATPSPTQITQPKSTQTMAASPTVAPVISCEDWQSRDVVPVASQTARALYQRGQENGNNPGAFSKIGDGEISADW